jgi:poly(A) polymerase
MLNIISNIPEAVKIYKLLNPLSSEENTSTKFVGGCVRDLILGHKIKDIDLATSFPPQEIVKILENENIKTNIKAINFGVVTAYINNYLFEITTLRKDLLQDGRYAKIEFIKDWELDSQRRDFTINAIYCEINTKSNEGFQLFDPHNGKEDLINGKIKFIKNAKTSINEDYVRALRYLRFFYSYSSHEHDPYVLEQIFKNKDNIKNLSQNRLKTELKKIITINPKLKIEKNSLIKDFFSYIYSDFNSIVNLSD